MFGKKKKEPPVRGVVTQKMKWPDGSFVGTETDVFFIKSGKRYRLYSPRVVSSWKADVVPSVESALAHIRKAGVLGFRDSTLIKDISDGRIYLIAGSKRCHITDPDVIQILGYQMITVSHDEAMIHEEGEELNGLGTA